MTEIMEMISGEVFSVWFLIGACLVFFMQAGFAMVEAGFTRAKNAGNIIMKNLVDFCIGTFAFILLGFGLMMSENYIGGFIGVPNVSLFTNFADSDWSSFVFNLVFCATAATIVSGAMAERTKFSAYCLYSLMISLIVYPIEAGWIWNSQGWLAQLGFTDFAGSCAIHMVGGVSALIGAKILGPRIGKYSKAKNGSIKVHAIPGHNITIGALGCFILWFAWYGFNGAAATNVSQFAQILGTTTIAAAFATLATMFFTWMKNGKPDVSMSLNGSLAGLVGITAGCSNVDALGAIVIGIVAGILVVVVVELMDMKLHIDDPVGAIAVHGACGIWGTLAVGLFDYSDGLFYGGGFHHLGVQLLGVVAVIAWVVVTMTIVFQVINKVIGLRVSPEEELAGLDSTEHGLESAYADFTPAIDSIAAAAGYSAPVGDVPVEAAVPVVEKTAVSADEKPDDAKFTKIAIVAKESKFEELKEAMNAIGITGMTVTKVLGCGMQKGRPEYYRGVEVNVTLIPKMKLEMVVCKVPVRTVIETAKKVLYTGHIGDGKIFVYDVENVVKIRTGEEGYDALQDVE